MYYPNPNSFNPYAVNYPEFPAYEQRKTEPEFQHVKYNHNYWWPLGVLRLFIILCSLGGIIASWLIVEFPALFYTVQAVIDTSALSQTVSALIVMFSIFFTVSLIIFVISITNFVNLPGCSSTFWLLLVSHDIMIMTGLI